MKKIISILLITISLNCFGQTSEKIKPDSTFISRIDSIKTMATPAFSINDMNAFLEMMESKISVTAYKAIYPFLLEMQNYMWQKAEAIRKQKPK